MQQRFDLIVVGAGMVGSALACALADSGLKLALLDAQSLACARAAQWLRVRSAGQCAERSVRADSAPPRRLAADSLVAALRLSSYVRLGCRRYR